MATPQEGGAFYTERNVGATRPGLHRQVVTAAVPSYDGRMFESPAIPLAISGVAAGALSASGLWAYSIFVPRCQFWAPVIRSLPQREAVALTFDDGPDEVITAQMLDVLAEHGVKATFFVIGSRARQQPALLKRMHAEGHAIGNHSLDHDPGAWKRDGAYWDKQLQETQSIVADITGTPPLLFRPPWGYKTRHIAAAAAKLRLPIIGWSVLAPAQSTDAAHYAASVLKRTTGHDILLLRDRGDPQKGASPDAQMPLIAALPAIIQGLREKNLQIIPLIDALVAASDQMQNAVQKHARMRA